MKKPKDFQLIVDRISAAENWRDSVYKDKWRDDLRQYRSQYKTPAGGNRSHIFIPETFMMVETVKSRIYESLFTNRPYVTILPRGNDDATKSSSAESLLDWQFNERMRIPRLFADDILPDAIIFGTTVVYTGWLKMDRKMRHRVTEEQMLTDDNGQPFLDEMGMPITMPVQRVVEDEVAIYDDPICQRVDIFDFFVDKAATNIQDARFCGHVEWLTKAQIESLEKSAGWKVNWKNIHPVEDALGGKEIRAELNGDSNEGMDVEFGAQEKGSFYKVHHYWEDDRHVVIINKEECALDEKNPFWHGQKPYDKCCYVNLTNEFYGMGLPEVVKDLQDELNTSRNQRIDYNTMALRRMWKVRKGCGLKNSDLVWRQSGVIPVEDMDDVQEILVQQLPASAFTNESVIKEDMKFATGVHDIVLGLANADETATTTMTKDSNASIRFKFFVEALVDDILLPVAAKCLALDMQYLEEERIIRLFDDNPAFASEIKTISPEELNGQYDFYYVGSSTEPMANKENYKQKVIEVYQLAMGNPMIQNDLNAQRNLLSELFKAAEMKDPNALLPAEPAPMMQQPMMPQEGLMQGNLTPMEQTPLVTGEINNQGA